MEEKQENEAPRLEAVVITQILGCVHADALVRGNPKRNSTRWVLDIEQQPGTHSIELHLLEFTSRRELRPDVISFSITPTSPDACDAAIWGVERDGCLTLHGISDQPEQGRAFSYRVFIDVLHSSTR